MFNVAEMELMCDEILMAGHACLCGIRAWHDRGANPDRKGSGKTRSELQRWKTEEVYAGVDRSCFIAPSSG